jgi:hypothetical protein
MRTGSRLAIIVFSIVATAHLLRMIFAISLTVGDWSVPQWVSMLGFVGPGAIAWMLWRESK